MKTQKYHVVGRDTVLRVREKTAINIHEGSEHIIHSSELNRIRASEAERQERGQDRKTRILEAEKLRGHANNVSAIELESGQKKNAILIRAQQAMDEELEEVKRMNRMIAFAKVQTILDLQKTEKEEIKRQHKMDQKKLEFSMEAERLKAISIMEERERDRQEEQRNRSLVILDQMKEREANKFLEEELRAKERLHMENQIAQEQARQEKQAEEKRKAQEKLFGEVLDFNAVAAKQKEAEFRKEKELDEKLLEYQRQRDLKEREREEANALEAARREAELSKLRSSQERANDKAVELDTLRAKRAIERAERQARQKEIIEKERLEKINASLAEARRIQQAEKQLMWIEEAKLEKREFDRMRLVQKQFEESEKRRALVEKRKVEEHSEELRKQMDAKHEKKLQERRDYLEEGNMVREQLQAESRRLNEIRQEKLGLILKAGVPDKHCMTFKKFVMA